MNAGLPSWNQLLENIYPHIGSSAYQQLASSDPDSPTRRAEYLLKMAVSSTASDEKSVVRDALYASSKRPTPGPLIDALAKLAVSLGSRATILTTNFDRLIEDALDRHLPPSEVVSYGLEDDKSWAAAAAAGGPGHVLHLHGLLEPKKTPVTNFVLTESHFLEYGPHVRKIIRERLSTDVVVFLGVSLTDPNLVGPLFGTPAANPRFLVVVPDEYEPDNLTPPFREQMDFYISKTKSVTQALDISPVVLKSHSQVAQLLWELNLAAVDKTAYRIGRGKKLTSTYGKRFTNVLAESYTKIGASSRSDFLTRPASDKLSNSLQDLLGSKHPLGKILQSHIDKHAGTTDGPEQLALFLWLRSRKHGIGSAPYSLSLVGTSAYVSRFESTVVHPQRISRTSKYTAVKAVFGGIATMQNLSADPSRTGWRGSIAVPVRRTKGNERFTIGAVALNSTHYYSAHDMPDDIANPQGALSFIGKLTSGDEFTEIISELEKAIQTLLR